MWRSCHHQELPHPPSTHSTPLYGFTCHTIHIALISKVVEGQLVAGPWGDLPPHLHQLLKLFAESRVATIERAPRYEAALGLLVKILGEIRRSFSVAVVRAQALCLLERLAQLGPVAAGWRQATLALDERRR